MTAQYKTDLARIFAAMSESEFEGPAVIAARCGMTIQGVARRLSEASHILPHFVDYMLVRPKNASAPHTQRVYVWRRHKDAVENLRRIA